MTLCLYSEIIQGKCLTCFNVFGRITSALKEVYKGERNIKDSTIFWQILFQRNIKEYGLKCKWVLGIVLKPFVSRLILS